MSLIDEIGEKARSRANRRELNDLLDDLSRFTREHFATEEQHMRDARYPRAEIHALIHRKLLARLHEHMYTFRADDGARCRELLSFLEFWLAAHVRNVDQMFVRHLAGRDAALR